MNTGDVSARTCPRCQEANTIRTQQMTGRESWYCYPCRRSFEIDSSRGPGVERRRGGDRRANNFHAMSDRKER